MVEETAARIGPAAMAVRLDVTAPKAQPFLDETEAAFGPVDVVVNNAGIMPLAAMLDESDAMTARILDLNVARSS